MIVRIHLFHAPESGESLFSFLKPSVASSLVSPRKSRARKTMLLPPSIAPSIALVDWSGGTNFGSKNGPPPD